MVGDQGETSAKQVRVKLLHTEDYPKGLSVQLRVVVLASAESAGGKRNRAFQTIGRDMHEHSTNTIG